ncbi:MAG: hypothetical protein ACTSVW_04090 [Candidatus Njordarchaeales archaeon]
MNIELKHLYSDSHILVFKMLHNGDNAGEIEIRPFFREIKIRFRTSEAIVLNGKLIEEKSRISDTDRQIIEKLIEEVSNKYLK